MAWSTKKVAFVAGGTVVGGAVCFLTAGAAAPAVGAFIGANFMGLSGAAATSAGLAALGGGAMAVGGGGMAAGAVLVTSLMTGAGAVLGTLGMGTLANFFEDSTQAFDDALNTQQDVAKAQEILAEQERRIRELQDVLDQERTRRAADASKIRQLEEAIRQLTALVGVERRQLASRTA